MPNLADLPLVNAVADVVADLVPPDPRAWCESYRDKSKVIHDAVWGTIKLLPHEVALLDTRIMQRLRRIHQTGAAHLIYPGARHTRFEHSIGVMHQADRMCRALVGNGQGNRVDDLLINKARLAGLAHDVGHGPFSHTSEQHYSGDGAFDEVRDAAGRYADSNNGELLSCLVLESSPFQAFWDKWNKVFGFSIAPTELSQMIAGDVPSEERYKSELIHGPFDADKLDYMYRDGHFTGLQIPIDLDRLFYSIAIDTDTEGKLYRLCGSSSATSPLMQIAFNKMLLFAGVYHHHKVRAVDCMLWSVFDLAKESGCEIGGVKLNTPADYLRVTDDEVLIPSLCNDPSVCSLIESVRYRRLWKRALVISRSTVPEAHYDPDGGDAAFHDLIKLAGNTSSSINRKREVSRLIAQKAGCQKHEVWLDVPNPPAAGEAQNMWIRLPGSETPLTLGEVMPIKQWVEIYSNTRYAAHVFCAPEHRVEVNKAAIAVLQSEFELSVNDNATAYAKID